MNSDKIIVAKFSWLQDIQRFGYALAEAEEEIWYLLATAREPRQLRFDWPLSETARLYVLDITLSPDIQAAVDTAIAYILNRIDVLINNNAGHGLIALKKKSAIFDTSPNFFWNQTLGALSLNLMRTVVSAHQLNQQGSRYIVNISSSTAELVIWVGSSLYCGAKFALEGTRLQALAKRSESFGIKSL